MKRDTLAMAGLIIVAAGCAALPGLPSQIQPPNSGIQAKDQVDTALMDVTIKVNVAGASRAVQFNGGTSTNNDITNLVVGLFDNGSGTSFVASLGYLYPGAVGSVGTPTTMNSSSTPTSPSYLGDLKDRLGTTGTTSPASSCACTINGKSEVRRYLVRDYGTATTFSSGSTTTTFTKVPYNGVNGHSYVLFTAAYDSAANNLGYSEQLLDDTNLGSAAGNNSAAVLNLNLKNNVFTNTLSEAPTITTFVPAASLRGYLPF